MNRADEPFPGSLKKDFRVFKYILKTKLLFLRRRRTDDKSDCGRY